MPIQSKSPHIRAKESVPQMMWTVVLALMPIVLAFVILFGFHAFRIFTVAVASALLMEMGMRKLFKKRASLHDGSALVTALLLALLLPSTLPSWTVAVGSAFAITVGKEIFGGLGQNPFNPTLVGMAFLHASFPWSGPFSTRSLQAVEIWICVLALFLGGLILLMKRLIYWEVPLLFGGIVIALSFLMKSGQGSTLFFIHLLLTSLFLVTDPVTTPLTRLGVRWFAVGAGLLTGVMRQGMSDTAAVTYGILLMNGLNPWLDRRFRPQAAKPHPR